MGPTRISPRSLFLLRFYLQIYCLLMSVLWCGFIACTGRAHPASLKSVTLLGKYSPSIEFHFGCDKYKSNEHSQYLWVTLKSKFFLRKSSSGIIQNNNKAYAAKKILDYLRDSTHKSCVLQSLVLGGLLHSWILKILKSKRNAWCHSSKRSFNNRVMTQTSHTFWTYRPNFNKKSAWE